MPGNESMFSPPEESRFVNVKTRSGFSFCQHSAISQSVIPRAQAVALDEIRDPQGREAGIVAATPRRSARAIPLLVEEFGDLRIDVFVEELVDQFDDTGLRLHLLRGRFWAHGGERLDFAALEADVNLGGPFRRHLDEGDVLNDVGEQPFAFASRRIRICPKLAEVYCHRDQPLANSFIENELILLSCAL